VNAAKYINGTVFDFDSKSFSFSISAPFEGILNLLA
jgi:hypothetical protein